MSFYLFVYLFIYLFGKGYLSTDNFCPLTADALNNTAQGSSKGNRFLEGNKPIQANEGWELSKTK